VESNIYQDGFHLLDLFGSPILSETRHSEGHKYTIFGNVGMLSLTVCAQFMSTGMVFQRHCFLAATVHPSLRNIFSGFNLEFLLLPPTHREITLVTVIKHTC
jgi:hypothetical protein